MKKDTFGLYRNKRPLALLALLLCGITLSACGEKQKEYSTISYIENAKVFDSFQMKKDYDLLMEKDMKSDAEYLDSLAFVINASKAKNESVSSIEQRYFSAEQSYNTKFSSLSTKYTTEVNERLNAYIKEYAETNGIRMILGTNGSGTLMYANEEDNITEDIIKFINSKYGDK